ncbi:MAG: orotidine 5'-phosphate decarboxylase [Thermoplasmatales archaeon B_DKE]|nr:MAG: orotidine 5'-phosphate decarboxylase [Thermoplasmatales archaeon B_DKE]QRF75684.1 Orotidine 5'-phosphate decarboxylase [Thermoplasmatales archaeon]
MPRHKRVIAALDVFESSEAIRIADQIKEEIAFIKVNWPLVMNEGIGIVGKLSRFSPVICDFKIADVPNTNALIARKSRENGAWGIISHQFTGRDSMEALIKEAGDMKVFSVVSMSNAGSRDFIDLHTDEMIDMSKECGVYGFVAPGNNTKMLEYIRSRVGNSCIISPGIGAQGGTPAEAIKHGADYIIIGRSIYESGDPVSYLREINSGL